MSATKTQIMYVQLGSAPGRIGRVRLSKTGRTLYYGDVELIAIGGRGISGNYLAPASGEEHWVSGPRKDGQDTLYPGLVEVDEDARQEYWRDVRGLPERVADTSFRSLGAHAKRATR